MSYSPLQKYFSHIEPVESGIERLCAVVVQLWLK